MTQLAVGDRIAVNPSHACGRCRFCEQGLQNHCLDMRYFGSAMRMPHVQGAFRQEIVVNAAEAYQLADGVSTPKAPWRSPWRSPCTRSTAPAPCWAARAGHRCGPIGALLVIAARRAGAALVVATDVIAQPLRKALAVGADQAINVTEAPGLLRRRRGRQGAV